MIFGQLVIGPPGSGKTTYCKAMCDFLTSLGRKVAVINIDPANDALPYEPKIDIVNLIKVEDVMSCFHMGPNGGLVYCMEYLETNFNWLLEELKSCADCYLLFDCPGQVELYTHHTAIHNILSLLNKSDFRLTAVHLVDSFYCCDPGKFISVLLTSLSTMLQMEMPHVNVLSKCDLIEKYGKLHLNVDFYTEVLDLSTLVSMLSDDPILSKYKKLNTALADVIENYSLVSFLALNVQNKDLMNRVLKAADKANGYVFGVNEEQRNIISLLSCATSSEFADANVADMREKYMSASNDESNKGFVSLGR